jgi:hypothetical protein
LPEPFAEALAFDGPFDAAFDAGAVSFAGMAGE